MARVFTPVTLRQRPTNFNSAWSKATIPPRSMPKCARCYGVNGRGPCYGFSEAGRTQTSPLTRSDQRKHPGTKRKEESDAVSWLGGVLVEFRHLQKFAVDLRKLPPQDVNGRIR